MEDAKQLWSVWQRNLQPFRGVFTRPGWVRFAQWVSGTVLCDEEHTITQELSSLHLEDRWRVWERFAEYGAWDIPAVERTLMERVGQEHSVARLGRYRPAAVDDTIELRSSPGVWGVCTFKHVSSRNAKQPKLARGHNWVILGELCPAADGEEPWTYLPEASRLYLRRTQLPPGETFRTKHELAVELLRELDGCAPPATAGHAPGAVLGIFDGGYARAGVVRECLRASAAKGQAPGAGAGRIEVLTRPRSDARLYEPLAFPQARSCPGRKKDQRGRKHAGGRGRTRSGRPLGNREKRLSTAGAARSAARSWTAAGG